MAKIKILEAAINYTNVDNCAYFSSNESKWISRIYRLKREHPDLVDIQQVPGSNGGYIMAGVPKEWFKLTPPKKRNYSNSEKKEIAERLKAARNTNTPPTL